jgi:membrane-bound serine protease (ClpP class)
MIRLRGGLMLATMVLMGLALAQAAAPAIAGRALLLEVDGVISPPIADYIAHELHAARPDLVRLIIVRMNTPGGLDTSMRQIISAILASPVPVATYVAPNGARAASAGTYIAYASAIAAMAPGTNIGAATPVQLVGNPMPSDRNQQKEQKQQETKPGEPADAETRKAVNDALAYIRSLAALNDRNADWAAEAVRSAASLPASEALSLHVIDVIADDIPDLLRKIDGRTVMVAGKPLHLATADLDVVAVPPNWRTELLTLVTNPNVAFILLLIGVYGLIFEFLNPGAVAPGLIGAISLLVSTLCTCLRSDQLCRRGAGASRRRPDGGGSSYRRLRRARRWWHRCLRHRIADDVSRAYAGFCPFNGSCRRRRDRQCGAAAIGAGSAIALTQAPGGHRQRGADRRRGRDRVLAGRRRARKGQG